MDPITMSALITGGLSAGSSLLGGMFGSQGQSATNAQQMAFAMQQQQSAQAFNASQSEINRDWQAQMSNTAYQRSMADMRAAGLNPILAANLGGASSPGGSAGSISPAAATLGNPGASMQAGVTSAGQAAATAAATKAVLTQAQKDQSQVDVNNTTADYNKSNTILNGALKTQSEQTTATSAEQAKQAAANARQAEAQTGLTGMQTVIAGHDANTAFQKSRLAKREADDREQSGQGTYGDLYSTGKRVAGDIGRSADWAAGGLWKGYSENIGQPFAKGVGNLIDKIRGNAPGEPGNGLVIDMKRR
ncbi:MAG: DNA pilot protein [Microvirus sp.]|nr:MAG: DNA pilot protein [Microvirus sp.]